MSCGPAGVSWSSIKPLCERAGYGIWKFKMRMYLMHEDLWETIVGYPDEKPSDANKRDQRALTKICLTIDGGAIAHVRSAETAKQAWDALKDAFEDKGMGRKLALERRLYRYNLSDFNDGVEQYISTIIATSQDLAEIGKKIDDESLAAIMLGGLGPRYDPLVMALENSNLKITSELVKGKLLNEFSKTVDVCELENKPSTSALKSQGKISSQNYKKKRTIKCYGCGEPGHKRPDCPMNKDEKEKYVKNVTLMTALNTVEGESTTFYIDTGATNHMCRNIDYLENVRLNDEGSNDNVTVANGEKISCSGIGNISFSTKDCIEGTMAGVVAVPALKCNLLSVKKACENDLHVVFDKNGCIFYENFSCTGNAVLRGSVNNGLYTLNCTVNVPKRIASNALLDTSDCRLWHRRLGHLCRIGMDKLRKGEAIGVSYDKMDHEPCIHCLEGKQSRKPFKAIQFKRGTVLLELIHADLCGPMSHDSFQGNKYLLVFIDDFSRAIFPYFISSKTQVKDKFCEFQNAVERQKEVKIKIFRTDNGTEFVNQGMRDYLTSKGIKHETTTPYSPQSNGVAERVNRTLVEKARCMLAEGKLSKVYWQDAVQTAAYLKNRSPHRALENKTPFEMWYGNKPNLTHLRVFGCRAMVHVPNCYRKKLDVKSTEHIFVGYTDDVHAYFFRSNEFPRRLVKARDVVFFENSFTSLKEYSKSSSQKEMVLPLPLSTDPCNVVEQTVNVDVPTTSTSTSMDVRGVCPDYFHDASDIEAEVELSNNVLGQSESIEERRYPMRERKKPDFLLYKTYTEEINNKNPSSYSEVMHAVDKDSWITAMQDEYNSLIERNTWILVDRPEHKKVIPCKWVYKLKRDALGNPVKYKARLVAKGYAQEAGVDYDETFSPVVRNSSLRLLLAFAVDNEYKLKHLDVDTAFLNGDLDEEVFMQQPVGFTQENGKVCLLKKSLYGLKQASRAWNKRLDETLKGLGFSRTSSESCVYTKLFASSELVILAVYVDDIVLLHKNDMTYDTVKHDLRNYFGIKDLGNLNYFLSLNVNYENGVVEINQKTFIIDLLKRFNMQQCKTFDTPLASSKLEPGTGEKPDYPYQNLIGSLMYLAVNTRPDIAFVVSFLSQFNTTYDKTHWTAAKRVLQYLKGTIDYSIVYRKTGEYLTAYADADWANCTIDRRSYTGYFVKFAGGPISWESKKQPTVALSSTEAEYMSLSSVTREVVFLRRFLQEISGKVGQVIIYNDCQGAQKLALNPIHHNRTKHIDTKHHFIRDIVSKKIIDLRYIKTHDMSADILTKALGRVPHLRCVKGMGLN